MSKKRSLWKNRRDGKTVRRNILAKFYSSRPVELLESPALRVLSRAAHLALIRIEVELRLHAGRCNGELIVTKEQFMEFGLHRHAVAPALRELEALNIISINHGRGGNAEFWQPNRFLLNYLCGAVDAHDKITNAWKQFKTLLEAEQAATIARAAKDPARVAFGRRKKHFPGSENGAGPKAGNRGFMRVISRAGNRGTIPGPETGPTIDTIGWRVGAAVSGKGDGNNGESS